MVSRKVKAVGLDTASLELWPVNRFPISQNFIQRKHPCICELGQSGQVTLQRSHRVCYADENHPWHWGTAQNLNQAWRRVSHNRRWSEFCQRTIASDNNSPACVQVPDVIILSYNKQHWRYIPITLLSFFFFFFFFFHKMKEKLMFKRLVIIFLIQYKPDILNYENQFGFCSGCTTTHASSVENKLYPSGKSLDSINTGK